MIPQEKLAAVTRSLRAAFGTSEFEELTPITKGQTLSLVFRIVVRGSPYLLKIITRAEDQTRHYTILEAAAQGGVAPRLVYANIPDKISITEYLDAAPLSRSAARVRLPGVLRTLHSLPPFARAPFNTTCTFLLQQGTALTAFLKKFQAANLLPEGSSEEFFTRLAELAGAYSVREIDLVSSHNDLFKPDNILFDGQRVWLVDWEAAFLNDRYADLAVVANQVVTTEEEETIFMHEYFGAPPTDYQLARLYLMQQVAHLFYTMAFLHVGAMGRPIDWTAPAPLFREYQSRIWLGEIDMAERDAKIAFAKANWEQLLNNAHTLRYADALRIAREESNIH